MRFGIIAVSSSGELLTKTGVAFRHSVSLNSGTLDERVSHSSLGYIVLIAKTDRTVFFDVSFPASISGSQLNSAIRGEVENFIPCPIQTVYWGYRMISDDGRKFRVFAAERDEADRLYPEIRKRHLYCDYFIPVQLLSDAPADFLRSGENPDEKQNNPLEVILNYLSADPGLKNVYLDNIPVPQDLRPQRFRHLRILCNISILVSCVLILSLLGTRYQMYSREISELRAKNAELRQMTASAEEVRGKLQRDVELQDKISQISYFGQNILPVLRDLNARLPNNMYITGYAQKSDVAEVTILSTTDDPNLTRSLMESSLYKADLRKTVSPDSQETVYTVTLKEIDK